MFQVAHQTAGKDKALKDVVELCEAVNSQSIYRYTFDFALE